MTYCGLCALTMGTTTNIPFSHCASGTCLDLCLVGCSSNGLASSTPSAPGLHRIGLQSPLAPSGSKLDWNSLCVGYLKKNPSPNRCLK